MGRAPSRYHARDQVRLTVTGNAEFWPASRPFSVGFLYVLAPEVIAADVVTLEPSGIDHAFGFVASAD
jgi:hypothetical protein